MGSFKITNERDHSAGDMISALFTGGLTLLAGPSDTTYTIEDENGVEHTVTARNEDELGEKIANGDFD